MKNLYWIIPVLVLIACRAQADEARPVYVEVEQIAVNEFLLKWKIPPVMAATNIPTIRLDHKLCRIEEQSMVVAPALLGKMRYHCGEAQSGFRVSIDYPRSNPALTSPSLAQAPLASNACCWCLRMKASDKVFPGPVSNPVTFPGEMTLILAMPPTFKNAVV